MTKNILKYVCIGLLAVTTILAIVTLVNYYSYANVLDKLQTAELDLLSKFELQEDKDLYLYRTLRLIPWTCYLAITTAVATISTFIYNLIKSNKTNHYKKIR